MPTDSLAVKDLLSEDGFLTSQLAFMDLGKNHRFGGCPRSNNLALAGLRWFASGNSMASGTNWQRTREIHHNYTRSSQSDTRHVSVAKYKRKKEQKATLQHLI